MCLLKKFYSLDFNLKSNKIDFSILSEFKFDIHNGTL